MGSLRRIRTALVALVLVTGFGTVGYLLLGFTLLEAVYQTVTTVATVGFREVHPLGAAGQVFTLVLIVVGVGTVLYNLGVMAEALTEGHLREQLERRRMNREISRMAGHVIVCGYGRVGSAAAAHLVAGGHEVVVVDQHEERLVDLDPRLRHLPGDVTDDDVLRAAGIDRARAVVIALDTDADTVYVTLAARSMRPDVVIVARARNPQSKDKMVLAGATRAVNPQAIGGRRLAMFALQPEVGDFLDVVMHDDDLDFRLQDITVEDRSALAGRTVGEGFLRESTGAWLLAIRRGAGGAFEPRPDEEVLLAPGTVLITLGTQSELAAVAALARA